MRGILTAFAACLLLAATAEPFREVTIGVPVGSIADAEAWYSNLFGGDVEVLRPTPGVVEFKIAPDVWFQIYETESQQPSGTVVRFLVDDIAATQHAGATLGIHMGEAIEIPVL